LSGICLPAFGVGGDYFDVLKLNDHQVALCVADVAGKGASAALLMANLQAAVHAITDDRIEPRALCRRVNEIICGNITSDRFITFFYGIVDVASRLLRYTNAGHNAPILLRQDGSFKRLELGGLVLGVDVNARYEQGQLMLASEDRLVLFTDGVVEAASGRGEEFGEERLLQILVDKHRLGAACLRDTVIASIIRFCGGRLRDDATVVIAELL
jgi:sigma-B regulation protein RsbU (phosphoserine phosphatase)